MKKKKFVERCHKKSKKKINTWKNKLTKNPTEVTKLLSLINLSRVWFLLSSLFVHCLVDFVWLAFGLCFLLLFLIFCSKNGEFTSRNSFCLETDHLKDARSREQCAGKLSKANLGVENRGETRTFRLFSAFPSLTGVVWHSPVEKLLFTFR